MLDGSSWFEDFGTARQRDPRIFLALFDKLAPVKKEIEEKFVKVADVKKKTTTALPSWSNVYHLGDLPDYLRPQKSTSFSRLLDRPVTNSRYVAIFLEEMCKLETCICGMIESQSCSLWGLSSAFAFIKDSGCALEEQIFHQLISGLQISFNSQAKVSVASVLYLMQKRRETLVSHLPAASQACS